MDENRLNGVDNQMAGSIKEVVGKVEKAASGAKNTVRDAVKR